MLKCYKCRQNYDISDFINCNGKMLKTCQTCRFNSKKWRLENKERISKYNKCYNDANRDGKIVDIVFARKIGTSEWIQFKNQRVASLKLGLYPSNVNKVIKGILKTTGGYEFYTEKGMYKNESKSWNETKTDNNYINKCVGQPSLKRVLHTTIDDLVGKVCCKCKIWRVLDEFNYSKSHWDKLRNDCKICLKEYRKNNRERINAAMLLYEQTRKKVDPHFRLMKILRSRVSNALSKIKANKYMDTRGLTGCDIDFLKNHIEQQFTEGMEWNNHGKWHLDHIIPCCSFDLTKEMDQRICFNWKNLQPLWKEDNLEKSGKYCEEEKNNFIKK